MLRLLFYFIFFIPLVILAQQPETVLILPWSDNNGVSYSELPEGRYGPQAGNGRYNFISTDLSTGVYFYRMGYNEKTYHTERFVHLK